MLAHLDVEIGLMPIGPQGDPARMSPAGHGASREESAWQLMASARYYDLIVFGKSWRAWLPFRRASGDC